MLTIGKTARSYPKLPYERIARYVLGEHFSVDLTFIGATRARELNRTHRAKHYTPNVLTFPLGKNTGEMYITPSVARKDAPSWGLSYEGYVALLFIHGLLHLKGHQHGDTMVKAEQRILSRFGYR